MPVKGSSHLIFSRVLFQLAFVNCLEKYAISWDIYVINWEKYGNDWEKYVINWEDSGHSRNITSITPSGYGLHRAGAIYGGGETISPSNEKGFKHDESDEISAGIWFNNQTNSYCFFMLILYLHFLDKTSYTF